MPVDERKIAELERQLQEARNQLLQEDGERFRIIMREISEDEKQRILENLKDRRERVLFGLEAPEEPKRRGVQRPAAGGGDEVCPYCGKGGLSKRGLALHVARLHKAQRDAARGAAA